MTPKQARDSDSDAPAAETGPSADRSAGVRTALRELAEGTAPQRATAHEATIEDAVDCTSCAREAAAFVAEGGVERLVRAVGEARAAGDEAAVERGRRALATLRGLRAAARGESADGPENQFQSGRGTVLPGAGQPPDR